MPVKQYDTPLILSTPHMTGDAVRDAQWLMSGNSRFEGLATFKDGKPDGDYGPLTAAATERTKFWLGYALTDCDGVFGQKLYQYLLPADSALAVDLPKGYQARREQRLAETNTPGLKAFEYAEGELGYKETPRNLTKYGVEYGFNGVPWCAIFLSSCFKHTGRPQFRYAAVERIYYDAINGQNGLRIVGTPRRGDVVCYHLHGTRFAHTAFYDAPDGSGFIDLGGNTGPADISNGGMVARGNRHMDQVLAFVRVG